MGQTNKQLPLVSVLLFDLYHDTGYTKLRELGSPNRIINDSNRLPFESGFQQNLDENYVTIWILKLKLYHQLGFQSIFNLFLIKINQKRQLFSQLKDQKI